MGQADRKGVAYPPRRHHHDPVRQQDGLVQVVGHEYHRPAVLHAEPGDQLLQLQAELGVDCAEGLVQQKNFRFQGQRPGHGDALLHAAGELAGIAVGGGGEPYLLHIAVGQVFPLLPAVFLPALPDTEEHVSLHGEPGKQGILLEHHRPVDPRSFDGLSIQGDFAAAGALKAVQQAEQRGFPAA